MFYRWKYRRNPCLEQGAVQIDPNQISEETKPSPPPSYIDVTNPPPYSVAIHIWHLLDIYGTDKTVQMQALLVPFSRNHFFRSATLYSNDDWNKRKLAKPHVLLYSVAIHILQFTLQIKQFKGKCKHFLFLSQAITLHFFRSAVFLLKMNETCANLMIPWQTFSLSSL